MLQCFPIKHIRGEVLSFSGADYVWFPLSTLITAYFPLFALVVAVKWVWPQGEDRPLKRKFNVNNLNSESYNMFPLIYM